MTILQSYLGGTWRTGSGEGTPLVDPTTEQTLAHASSEGLDLGAALDHARREGGPALRAATFAQRAAMLSAMADAIHAERDALIELGIRNAGNTRGDAKFDIDGATATLKAYAHWGAELPGGAFRSDGDVFKLGRSPRFSGTHVLVPRRGVAVHVNAFNFPAWGMMEKAACALLAGVPVLEKPGTPTAMMAERIARLIVESGALPEGAFSFLAGGAGDLLDHVRAEDAVAFTGSSGTATTLRRHAAFVERGARLNVEADSLNAAVLGPDADPEGELFELFVSDVARDVTQKAGQKCTCIRRVLVPEALADAATEALAEALAATKVGDPGDRANRMGPLVTADQLAGVRAGIDALGEAGTIVTGGRDPLGERGYFVAPTLVRAPAQAEVVHREEVFGPVATLMTYDGSVEAAADLVRRGGGGLVSSVYSDDRDVQTALGLELAATSGRVYLGSSAMAEHGTGPGTVLPSLVHGGPGRAGGGEELGGLRGLSFWMQRAAVQGFRGVLESGFSSQDSGEA